MKFIISIRDCFTRFVEFYAVSDTTAENAAKSLLAFMGRYGTPAEILSDNGSQFVNSLIESLSKFS